MMKTTIKTILYLLLSFIFLRCSYKGEDNLLDSFKNEKQIKGVEIPIDDALLGNPMELITIDTFLLVVDYFDNTWLNIFSINTGKQIKRDLNSGKGPNEIQRPYKITVTGERTFDIYDIFTKRLLSYDIDDILSEKKSTPFLKEDFKSDTARFLQILRLPDNKFFGTGIIFGGKYCVVNKKDALCEAFGEYPADEKHNNAGYNILGAAYQGLLELKPDGSKIVWANLKSPILEIIEIKDDKFEVIKKINFGLPLYDEYEDEMGGFSAETHENNKLGFRDINVTNEYIYALYSGRTFEEFDDKAIKCEYILVYDWEGNPLKKMKLERDVNSITVTLDNKYIYAIAETPFPRIIRYTL
ncbi:MAG TPA: BF3164 family lipoprotein [Bacteroidales bacterium]|nr:BF3164 family lipoprotein [Bacteroidales bacterium]